MRVLTSVLVANRGEIARRVFRSCRSLGLATVAVYADPDAGSPHVAEADAAVRLPGRAAADTYLRADLLIAAALRAGADAVHPGYGFLSENAEFARAVQASGLTWIGPSPEVIAAMGSKITSKRLMAVAGLPVLTALDPGALSEADLPVLIKASAGGGGRGLRVVRALAQLPDALAAAASEAASAFGDAAVFCEPYVERGRHVEVQVLADNAGTVWTVGERECSIQRRHQKIIEEAPSPLVERTPGMRERLLRAAALASSAIGYVNAGTVEFLADETGRFWFLEMNTRLQVEHPVTECTTGLDLVALQLQIAAGRTLPATPPPTRGHAIEARLYAEDPAAGWQAQTGTLHAFALTGEPAEFRAGPVPGEPVPAGPVSGGPVPAGPVPAGPVPAGPVSAGPVPAGPGGVAGHTAAGPGLAALAPPVLRLDSGVVAGTEVGIFYDPMLAKVIAWAAHREQAAAVLARALATARIHGLITNRDLLVRVLRHPAFLAGQTDTAFFDTHGLDALAAPLADPAAAELSALAAALAAAAARHVDSPALGGLPLGWRNVPSQLQRARYAGHEVGYRIDRGGLVVEGRDDVRLMSLRPDRVELEVAGIRRAFEVSDYGGLVHVDSALGPVTLVPQPWFADPAAQVAAGSVLAPMPGTVVRLAAAAGDEVAVGQPLLWLEAMKMEHLVAAPAAGIVAELPVAAGQQVEVGTVLAVVKPEEDPH